MKPTWFVTSTLAGLGVYLLLELVFGQYGMIAFRTMEEFRSKAAQELEVLQRQTLDLQRQVRLLTTDSETIRLEARDIGLVGMEEIVVRLENHETRPRHRYQPGAVPSRMPRIRDNRPLFRSLGFTVFLVTLLVQLIGSQRTTRGSTGASKHRERPVRGRSASPEDEPVDQVRARHSR